MEGKVLAFFSQTTEVNKFQSDVSIFYLRSFTVLWYEEYLKRVSSILAPHNTIHKFE